MGLRSAGGSDRAPEDPAALRKVLLEEGTPDAEWLRAFRRYAVAELIAKESSRPDALPRQRKKQ
jgi:hypothetical protein